MATPKSLRVAPPRNMDNYTVSMRKFQGQDPPADPDKSFFNFVDDGISNYQISQNWDYDIGFKVTINGKTYTKFGIFPGIVILQDPNEPSPAIGNYLNSIFFYDNALIKSSFDDDHILLCPWFDIQTYASSTPENLQVSDDYNSTITASILQQLKEGKESQSIYDWPYDSYDRGIRYKHGNDTHKGRYLVVRFTCYTYNDQYPNRLKYEVVVYENGTIEFRYWNQKTYAQTDSFSFGNSNATCGIFWSGPSNGSNKFRDFSPLFDYDTSSRVISELGGAAYDPGYSESSVPYSNQLSYNDWPKNGGSIISFSPPVNVIKYLPQQTAKVISAVRPFASPAGLFDDRRSTVFGLTTSSAYPVNMPSTLSTRLLGDTNPVINTSFRQHLFTSGGLLVESGTQSKAVIDGMLNQIDLFAASKTSYDSSFNESSKPALGPVVNEFYSIGTAELADRSLESILQSKVHFHMSLPITKPILMPSSSASLYYYDSGKSSWDYVGGDTFSDSVAPARYFVSGGLDISVNNKLLAVIENGRGFDAVGRKIVSGGIFLGTLTTSRNFRQRTAGVGTLFNTASFEPDERADQLISTTYGGSITDAPKYFPTTTQTISFNTDQPFLIEKIVAKIPIYASGSWFEDVTTVNKAFGSMSSPIAGFASGAIDFGGPGLTFAIHCPRKSPGRSYMDLIASGTITHNFDNISGIKFYKEPGMAYTCLRPIGFRSFSQPTAVVSGTWNGSFHEFSGHVTLEMAAAVHGGISFVRNDIASGSAVAKQRALDLLTSQSLPLSSDRTYNYVQSNDYTRVHVQQVSPLSRGTSALEFNGNSVVGRSMAAFNLESNISNPIFAARSGSLSLTTKNTLDSPGFDVLDAVMQYSTVDNLVSPYMIFPGDKLTFSISKTRPVIYQANYLGLFTPTPAYGDTFGEYALTGSHNGVVLNTGSIDITFYGSYIKEGIGYIP